MDEQQQYPKQALDKFRQWHFWWLVIFSFLLIVTFVWYLPTRFLYQFTTEAPHGHNEEEAGHEHAEGEAAHDHGTGGEMMMSDEEMHEHMDEHMGDMDMDEMMDHMMEEHGMEHEDADMMMDEMMGHEHEEGDAAHDHGGTATESDDHSEGHAGTINYYEEADVKNGLAVNLNISPVPYRTGVPLTMNFFVNNKPGNVPVPASELEIEHEKLMHVVGLRSDMNEFFHIHPQPSADPGVFTVTHTFNKPGSYKIWSDVKQGGEINLYGHPEVNVNGTGPTAEKNVSFTRNVVTGNYQVSMTSSDTVVANREVNLSFDIHTLNGQEINVENYLGAQMHLVLIKDDWSEFVHTHPAGGTDSEHGHTQADIIPVALADEGHEHADTEETSGGAGGDEVITFSVAFSSAGLYKAFAQFRPEGIELPADEALLAEFWIQVEEKAPFPVSQWWGLLVVSAILMAGLSWAVSKYLEVKPEDVKMKK